MQMTTYTVSNKQRNLLLAGIVVGVISMALTWMNDDALHTRFWTNFLHNSVFFTGISLMAVFFYSVCTTAWGGWHIVFKRVWESMGMFLVVGLGLMAIIAVGTVFDIHHLYHWADQASVESDKILQHKSSFLNNFWYIVSIVIVAVWMFFAYKIRQVSIQEDAVRDKDYKQHFKNRFWTATFLPIAGFSVCLVIWQWVMSIDAHWYSTMFAWYSGASLFVSMIAMTILILIFLKSKGYYPNVSLEHFHDLGKFMFGFSVFWTYLWFSQYMLIWYANVGEETVYFKTRQDQYPILFYANLVINFVLPFLILMRNDTKRKFGTLIFVALLVIFGHWLDFFLMIKPGALHTAHEVLGSHGDHSAGHMAPDGHGSHAATLIKDATDHADGAAHAVAEAGHHAAGHAATFEAGFSLPGFLEIGTMIGFLCAFLYFFYVTLGKSNLVPKNDPYLSESLHHHV